MSFNPIPRFLVFSIAWTAGAALMGLEILGGRTISPYFGFDVVTWGVLVGVILFALSLGYLIGGYFADRKPALPLTVFCLLIAGAWIFLMPRFSAPICWFIRGMGIDFGAKVILGILALFFFPNLALGAIQPLLLKNYATKTENLGRVSGGLWAASSFGSLIACFFTTFVLLSPRGIGTSRSLEVFGAALLLLTGVLVVVSGRKKLFLAVCSACLLVLVSLAVPFDHGIYLRAYSEMHQELIARVSTPYHDIQVVDLSPVDQPGKRNRLLTFGESEFPQSRIGPALPWLVDLKRRRGGYRSSGGYALAGAMNPGIKRIAMIGFGGGTILRNLIQLLPAPQYPDVRFDAVDVDGEVFSIAEKYFEFPISDKRLRTFIQDGRIFIQSKEAGPYDLILIDPSANSVKMPDHFMTQEFFREIRNKLSPGGIMAVNVLTSMADSAPLYAVLKTVESVFPGDSTTIMIDGLLEEGLPQTSQFLILFATNGERTLPNKDGFRRWTARAGEASRHYPIDYFIQEIWSPKAEDLWFSERLSGAPMLTDDSNPLNYLISRTL